MRRIIYGILILGFLHLVYGLFISYWKPQVFAPNYIKKPNPIFYDYSGAINVHSKKSSGSGSPEDIALAANSAELNFVVITDTDNFSSNTTTESYLEQVLMLNGGEYGYQSARILNIDPRNTNHLLGPGRSRFAFSDILSNENSDREEGIFVVAHPFKSGYEWTAPVPVGLDGIELINLKSIWQEIWLKSKFKFLLALTMYPFNSNYSFLQLIATASFKEFSFWDKINSENSVYGFAGSDAEANVSLFGDNKFKIPSYRSIFNIVKNHVLIKSELTGQADADRKKITNALRHGEFYMSLDMIHNPTGFVTYLNDGKEIFPLGSKVKLRENLEYVVKLPDKPIIPFEIVIYKNGEVVLVSTSAESTLSIHDKGVYRAIVRLKVNLAWPQGPTWINWIITNPIFIE